MIVIDLLRICSIMSWVDVSCGKHAAGTFKSYVGKNSTNCLSKTGLFSKPKCKSLTMLRNSFDCGFGSFSRCEIIKCLNNSNSTMSQLWIDVCQQDIEAFAILQDFLEDLPAEHGLPHT